MKSKLKLKKSPKNQQQKKDQTLIPSREEVLSGCNVVVATRRGHVIKGKYKGFVRGSLCLADVTIIGTKYRTQAKILFVPENNLAHIHPEPEKIEIIGG